MKQVENTVSNSGWNTFWWIIGSICMPLTAPYIVQKAISMLRFRKNRGILCGKVSAFCISLYQSFHYPFINDIKYGLLGCRYNWS